MNIEVTVKNENTSQEVRDYAFEKAKKVSKFFQKITKVEVILKSEKDKHSAEMIISASRGTKLVGKAVHEEAHASIDLLLDKMERQLVRFKERLKDHRSTKVEPPDSGAPASDDDEVSYDEIIRKDYGGGK